MSQRVILRGSGQNTTMQGTWMWRKSRQSIDNTWSGPKNATLARWVRPAVVLAHHYRPSGPTTHGTEHLTLTLSRTMNATFCTEGCSTISLWMTWNSCHSVDWCPCYCLHHQPSTYGRASNTGLQDICQSQRLGGFHNGWVKNCLCFVIF